MEKIEINEIINAYMIRRTEPHRDARGFFSEVYRACDIEGKFVQRNVSASKKNVLRGMHSLWSKPQGKLITCLYGKIWDVIYDARPRSPTFGRGYALELSHDKMNSLFAPPGCLHGFLVLSDLAIVEYDCTSYFEPRYDGGVKWSDPQIKKFFPQGISPVLSSKDEKLGSLSEFIRLKS
jgi:dTDP-4-dehydrorhamnose 3,5-epimerase